MAITARADTVDVGRGTDAHYDPVHGRRRVQRAAAVPTGPAPRVGWTHGVCRPAGGLSAQEEPQTGSDARRSHQARGSEPGRSIEDTKASRGMTAPNGST